MVSCAKRTGLQFDNPVANREALQRQAERLERRRLDQLAEHERQKVLEWKEIVTSANTEFKTIAPMIQRKCFSCHDANTKLPFYGRILRSRNPISHHQVDGIKSLDFSKGFPLQSLGSNSQLALLKAIRASTIERSMPIKIYRVFYPKRKITDADETAILTWTDPLISKIEAYNLKYDTKPEDPVSATRATFEAKCFRCHANGNARGGFGGMEKLDELRASSISDRNDPESSKLYKIMAMGKMPPDPSQALTQEELQDVRDWMIEAVR